MSHLRIIFLSLLIGACAPIVPATTPPQLEHTPGTFVIVTNQTFDGGDFRIDYPQSWRVVKTSIASTPQIQVVFVTPNESSITLTEVEAVNDATNSDERFITLDNDVIIQVLVTQSDGADDTFLDLANQLINSIRPSIK